MVTAHWFGFSITTGVCIGEDGMACGVHIGEDFTLAHIVGYAGHSAVQKPVQASAPQAS